MEREVLPASAGQPLAAADPDAAPAGVGPRIGQHQHLRLRRRARRLLLLPQLLGRPLREDDDGRLLARGGRARQGGESLPGGVPAAGGGGRQRRAGRGALRAPRRVLLSQVPARAGRVVRAAGQPGLPQHGGGPEQPGAACGEPQDAAVPRLRRQGLRHRRQPGHRARPPEGGGRPGPAGGQPHGAAADRLDAPRAGAGEHRAVRPRGAARPARRLGGRGLGEPLVARTAAPAPGRARGCGRCT